MKYVIIPANVREVRKEGNKILVPLIPLCRPETTHLLATAIYDMHRLGLKWKEIKEYFHIIPNEWTLKAVINYIKKHGRRIETKESFESKNPFFFETEVTFDKVEKEATVKPLEAYEREVIA